MYGWCRTIFAAEDPISRVRTGERSARQGAYIPPFHQLVKTFFDKLRPHHCAVAEAAHRHVQRQPSAIALERKVNEPHILIITKNPSFDRISVKGRILSAEKTSKSSRESKSSRPFIRVQRCVRWVRDDFCNGTSHFPERKSLPCRFYTRKSERFQQKPESVAVAAEPASPSQPANEIFALAVASMFGNATLPLSDGADNMQ